MKEYYQGVYDACKYLRDELGYEDVMQTDIAIDAMRELGIEND